MSTAQIIPYYPAPAPVRRNVSPYPRMADTARKFIQGAGSAALIFNGAGSMTAPPAGGLAYADFSSLEGLTQSLLSGQLAGPAQMAAAILVFIAAGQCRARFIGFAVAALFLFLSLKGVTPEDARVFADHFAQRLAAAGNAFLTAEVG